MRTLLCSAAFFVLTLAPLSATATQNGTGDDILSGTVVETMNSGGYTYMNVRNTDGQTAWVAIPKSTVTKGEKVQFYNGMVMENFPSKTLNRTFKSILFSQGLTTGTTSSPHAAPPAESTGSDTFTAAVAAEKTAPAAEKKMQQRSGGSAAAVVPFEKLEITKAAGENAATVDEVFENAAALNGKKVAVRGRVMKVSNQIMGRNWVHLQDGTGNAMKNRHDLVVTTTDDVKPGTEVVIEGVLAAPKDFGAGYTYEAIVEQATVRVVE